MMWKKKKVLKKWRKFLISGQCSMKRGKTILNLYSNILLVSSVGARKKKLLCHFLICIQTGSNAWVLVWKEENLFIFNLTFGSCRSLYGAKKIFHSIVGSNGGAWVVKVWKEKPIFFIINLANRYLFTLYGAGKEISTIFIST